MDEAKADLLDAILAVYEARSVGLSAAEIDERGRGVALGKELNRLAGAVPNAVEDRLCGLWCTGRVSHEEYVDLVAEIARKGLFALG